MRGEMVKKYTKLFFFFPFRSLSFPPFYSLSHSLSNCYSLSLPLSISLSLLLSFSLSLSISIISLSPSHTHINCSNDNGKSDDDVIMMLYILSSGGKSFVCDLESNFSPRELISFRKKIFSTILSIFFFK